MLEQNLEHTTQVTIQVTQVKCLDESNNEVIIIDCYGKLNVTQSKQIAKDNGLTYISKQLTSNTHSIKTSELIKLV